MSQDQSALNMREFNTDLEVPSSHRYGMRPKQETVAVDRSELVGMRVPD